MTLKKELARVEDCRLVIEDHGILTCMVDLNLEDGIHQGFGGYSLDGYDEKLDRRVGTAGGMDWILQILQIFSVTKLEDVTGKMCYALYDADSTRIQGLQTLEIDGGRFFKISDWQKQWFSKEEPKK